MKFSSMRSEQDAWWAPPDVIEKHGRLNRPRESILYLSNRLSNVIYETRCKPGEFFFVMVYTNIKRMRVAQLHDNKYMLELTELENAKRILMHNFLVYEFIKNVPEGREYEYMSSLIIYEQFFKHKSMDAFVYPSISSPLKLGYNIAFPTGKAKENLSLQGIMVVQLVGKGKDSEFNIKAHYDGFYENEPGFSFYPFNSNVSREKFGKFSMVRDRGM